jgi:dihydropteroate synthase
VVSVDTYRARTADAALDAGASIVNDVTALRGDPRMAALVADAGCPVVLMHMLGEPKTMQKEPRYDDVTREVRGFLEERAGHANAAGVRPENIIIDPGIGFGKTLEHNLTLLARLDEIVALGPPVLLGASRKRFLGSVTGAEGARDRHFGTVAITVLALRAGRNSLPRTRRPCQPRSARRGRGRAKGLGPRNRNQRAKLNPVCANFEEVQSMFERFTERARKVVVLAQDEARHF